MGGSVFAIVDSSERVVTTRATILDDPNRISGFEFLFGRFVPFTAFVESRNVQMALAYPCARR